MGGDDMSDEVDDFAEQITSYATHKLFSARPFPGSEPARKRHPSEMDALEEKMRAMQTAVVERAVATQERLEAIEALLAELRDKLGK